MSKKLTLLAMAVAAVAALVVPAAASAAGQLTMPEGMRIAPETGITLVANGTLFTETALGELECEEVMANGEVTKNNGEDFEGVGVEVGGSFGTTNGCSIEGAVPVTITSPRVLQINSTTTGTGTIRLTFIAHIPVGPEKFITCHFETPAGTPGVFHYTVNTDVATLTPTALVSELCGNASISGSATIETANGGGPVLLS